MSDKDKRIARALSTAKRMNKSKKAEGGTAGGIPLTPGIFTEMDKQLGPSAWRGSTIKNQGVMKVPIKDIEHGEAAMPGGTLTWPNARELIHEYANRPTPFPPIEAIPPDATSPKWMVYDGSRRLEAAKLRGDTHIDVKPLLPQNTE